METATQRDVARDKIVTRVVRLLALAQSPNQHEATSARHKAVELMTRHGLTEGDLVEHPADGVFEMALASDRCAGFSAEWKWRLASHVARAHGCVAVGLWAAKRRKVRLVGVKSAVELAGRHFHVLYDAVRAEGEVVLRSMWAGRTDLDRATLGWYAQSYLRGIVEAVAGRIFGDQSGVVASGGAVERAVPSPEDGVLVRREPAFGQVATEHAERRYGVGRSSSRSAGRRRAGACDVEAFLDGHARGMTMHLPYVC